jgi:uncharacterized protein (TIGR00730 family)
LFRDGFQSFGLLIEGKPGLFFFYLRNMKTIAVYCGSSTGLNGVYREEAIRLGRLLVEKGISLVFGGGKVGLMGVLADAVLEAGGVATGIIPSFLEVREVAHGGLTRMITVETMHERKALISEMSDGFIAMPGGFGTLDEVFEILTWGQLGLHGKPVGVLNVNGYYDSILGGLDTMVSEGFLRQENRDILLSESKPESLLDRMLTFSPLKVPKWL